MTSIFGVSLPLFLDFWPLVRQDKPFQRVSLGFIDALANNYRSVSKLIYSKAGYI